MRGRISVNEESPSIIEQDAGEIPVKATLRKVQQKITAAIFLRFSSLIIYCGKGEKARQKLTVSSATKKAV